MNINLKHWLKSFFKHSSELTFLYHFFFVDILWVFYILAFSLLHFATKQTPNQR